MRVPFHVHSVITIKLFLGWSKNKTKKSRSEATQYLHVFPRTLPFQGHAHLHRIHWYLADVKTRGLANKYLPWAKDNFKLKLCSKTFTIIVFARRTMPFSNLYIRRKIPCFNKQTSWISFILIQTEINCINDFILRTASILGVNVFQNSVKRRLLSGCHLNNYQTQMYYFSFRFISML